MLYLQILYYYGLIYACLPLELPSLLFLTKIPKVFLFSSMSAT